MDPQEHLRAVDEAAVTMTTQRMAGELISSLTQPRLDSVGAQVDAGDTRALLKVPAAAWLDLVDAVTGFATKRPQIYHFNRELGFSRTEALHHTSPSTGLAAAAIVLSIAKPVP